MQSNSRTGTIQKHRFRALGTDCEFQFVAGPGSQVGACVSAVVRWVESFEAKFTRFRDDSLVGRINASAGSGEWIPIDEEAERIFRTAGALCEMTGGLLDASALPLLRLWDYRAKHDTLPDDAAVAKARNLTGWRKVQLEKGRIRLPEPGMGIDLGGFGKEYAVDAAAEIIRQHGVGNFLVDFGHDVRVLGKPPDAPSWRIGVEDPRTPGKWWCVLALRDGGVATSGDYIRRFVRDGRRYGHIIDPRTGRPSMVRVWRPAFFQRSRSCRACRQD